MYGRGWKSSELTGCLTAEDEVINIFFYSLFWVLYLYLIGQTFRKAENLQHKIIGTPKRVIEKRRWGDRCERIYKTLTVWHSCVTSRGLFLLISAREATLYSPLFQCWKTETVTKTAVFARFTQTHRSGVLRMDLSHHHITPKPSCW